MASMQPIDAWQHTWWFRLRRLGRWGFSLLGGAFAAPLVTCLLYGSVVWFYGYPFSAFVGGSVAIWLISAPVYVACFLWTWSHMQKRYRVTLASRCPRCGYALVGGAPSERCPECGEPVERAA